MAAWAVEWYKDAPEVPSHTEESGTRVPGPGTGRAVGPDPIRFSGNQPQLRAGSTGATTSSMAEFSWSDSVKAAFAPCLSCLNFSSRTHHNDQPSSQNSSRPDLDRLLQDVDTDTEVETLSLHSNIGDSRRKRKKKRRGPSKNITLFGFNLFGKPPIRLEGGDDLAAVTTSPTGGHNSSSTVKKSISTSTLDSDAAPLDPSTIAQLSAAQSPSPGPSEEEVMGKEERRRRRRERKDMKEALAKAMARPDAEFEGFPGSGPGLPAPSSPRGFVLVSSTSPNEDPAEDPDFDAQAYNTRRHPGTTRSESDSRSRTSASLSNPDFPSHYHHHHSSQQPAPIPAPSIQRQNSHDIPRKKRKSSRPKGSSSSKTSQTPPLRSPVEPTFQSRPIIVEPEFEGFPNDGAFPSTGFGGRMSRKNSEMGVFLARRGDD